MFKERPQNCVDEINNTKWDAATECMKHSGLKCVYVFYMCAKPGSVLTKTV